MNLLSNFGAVINRSLSPRQERLHTIIVFGETVFAILIVSAIACADSNAGRIHSVLMRNCIASSASSSVDDVI